MATINLGFDIAALTKGQIYEAQRSERIPLQKLSAIRAGLSVVTARALAGVTHWLANHAIDVVDERTRRLAKHAVWFEGAKDLMIQDLALTAQPWGPELLEPLAKLQHTNRESIKRCEEIIAQLRGVNPTSRVAEAFDRFRAVVLRLDGSLEVIRKITVEGLEHADVLEQIRVLQGSVDEKIAQYMDDDVEFDPALVALADQALDRISAGAKAQQVGS